MPRPPHDQDPEFYFTNNRPVASQPKRTRWWLPVTIIAAVVLLAIVAVVAVNAVLKGISGNVPTSDPVAPGPSSSEVEAPVQPEAKMSKESLKEYLPKNIPSEIPDSLPENLEITPGSIPTLDPNTPVEVRSQIRTQAATSHIPTLTVSDPATLDASAAEVCQILDNGAGPLALASTELPVDSMTDQGKFIGLAIATECPEHTPVIEKWYDLYNKLAG